MKNNDLTQKMTRTQETFEVSFAKFNVKTNRFSCSECHTELDGSKANTIKAIVDGKMQSDVAEITCPKCGKTFWLTASDVEQAAELIAKYEAIVRTNELKAIWNEMVEARREVNAKAAAKQQWNSDFAARFTLVYKY